MADVGQAIKEMARVAKPGARVGTTAWTSPDRNNWATTSMGPIGKFVQMPAPPPGLFRCGAPGYLAGLFRAAGLKNVTEWEQSGYVSFDSAQSYWAFMSPGARVPARRPSDGGQLDQSRVVLQDSRPVWRIHRPTDLPRATILGISRRPPSSTPRRRS